MVQRIGGHDTFPDDVPNAWEEAVVEMCIPVLEQLPEYLHIDVASAVYAENRIHSCPDTPWAVIFNDETPEWIGAQLLSTCLTPDGQTPSRNPELRQAINSVNATLKAKDIERGPATVALARMLIQTVAGKNNTPFRIYADTARLTPTKHSWSDTLVEQFGEIGCRDILAVTPKLDNTIRETEALTSLYYDPVELDYQVHPESNGSLIHGFLSSDERHTLYSSAAHQIRGLLA